MSEGPGKETFQGAHAAGIGCHRTFHKSFQLFVPLCSTSIIAVQTANAAEQGLPLTQGLLSDNITLL